MNNKSDGNEEQIWYIYINEETRGPLSLRDLDVLLRTNQITSNSFGWKNGMKDWKSLQEIEEIKESILQSSKEILQIQKNKGLYERGERPPQQQPQQNEEEEEDQLIENQDENPLTILQVTVENLLQKTFHQSKDGKWNIYDEQKGQWIVQDEQPTEKIAQMKSFLFNKLKTELFLDDKGKKRKTKQKPQSEVQENLTKQQLQKKERNKKKTKRAAQKKKEKWYHAKINTFIYISGLPFDITENELKQFALKAGVLRIDLNTGEEKIKIYKDQNNFPKGDAVISYAKEESVNLAIQILNDSEIRQGFRVKVERAHFNQKDEEYKRRETKKSNKVKKMLAKINEEKMLAWDDQGSDKGEGFKIIVLKHVFSPELINSEDDIQEIKRQMTEEIEKIGEVKRIRFHQTHPQGIVQVKFEKDKDAKTCKDIMDGRFFDGRQIRCEYWDGETDYKRDGQSLLLQEQQLEKFGSQIEKEEGEEKVEEVQQ